MGWAVLHHHKLLLAPKTGDFLGEQQRAALIGGVLRLLALGEEVLAFRLRDALHRLITKPLRNVLSCLKLGCLRRKDDLQRVIRREGLRGILAVDLNNLRRALNDRHKPQAIAGDVADALRQHLHLAGCREFVADDEALVLERWISLGKLARVQVDQLLEKQVQQRRHAVQVVGSDAEVDRHALLAHVPQIEVVCACRGIHQRVVPELEARPERSDDTCARVL